MEAPPDSSRLQELAFKLLLVFVAAVNSFALYAWKNQSDKVDSNLKTLSEIRSSMWTVKDQQVFANNNALENVKLWKAMSDGPSWFVGRMDRIENKLNDIEKRLNTGQK